MLQISAHMDHTYQEKMGKNTEINPHTENTGVWQTVESYAGERICVRMFESREATQMQHTDGVRGD